MIENIDKTIEFLKELRKEEQKKQLEELKKIIKKDIKKEIENALLNFESDNFVKFLNENKLECCFSFNFENIISKLEEIINVDVWNLD